MRGGIGSLLNLTEYGPKMEDGPYSEKRIVILLGEVVKF